MSNLGLNTLFRTELPPGDPNFLPSCNGRGDARLGSLVVPDDDPSKPYRFWWDPSGKGGDYLVWNGQTIAPVSLTSEESKMPNLPGVRAYPPYVVPFTNAMWVQVPGFPANTFPSSWLSQQADAQALVAMFPGATLETGQTTFPDAVFSLGDTPAGWSPWVMVLPDGVKTFAGGLIEQMYGPNHVNGGGRGNPGSWQDNVNANGTHSIGWAPAPHPSGQSASTLGQPCLPIPAGYQLGQVENGITFITMLVPTGGWSTETSTGTIGGRKYTLTLEG